MLLNILISICLSQTELTYEEQIECVSDLEVCQAQVGTLVSSLEQDEYPAQHGTFTTCPPESILEMSTWWSDRLSSLGADLYVCDADIPYWAILMADGTYRSTCVAYSTEMTAPCPSDEIYCSATINDEPVYGYAGNVLQSLQQAIDSTTSTHPWCPKGSCAPVNEWMAGQLTAEGISSEDAAKICKYGDDNLDQYYYIADSNTIINTCVVAGDQWDTECNADAGRVCSGIYDGMNIVGWPRMQARFVFEALATSSFSHPQCTTA